ncbi:MAG: T9SS type A sorting domain-containing protein [Candidatus Neomarinimicrobiota bacterium]
MKRLLLVSFCFLILVVSLSAKDTTDVLGIYSPGGGAEGSLNDAIQSAIDNGTLSNTVFRLKAYDYYVLTGTIKVPVDNTLEIVGEPIGNVQDCAPPQIVWTNSDAVDKDFLIAVYGDLYMKNVWVRFADAAGVQTGTPIVFDGDTLGVSDDSTEIGYFENCIFEWMPCPRVTSSGAICVRSKHFNGTFKNCYFRNCVDKHFMYYGRAVSFPFDVSGYHTENITFENCTFANMGYVLMQEGTNWSENVHFNHCTFYNVVMFSLESGWWLKLNVTNSLFVNAFMMGFQPAQGTNPASATVTITPADSIRFVTFTDQERRILFAHNAYYIDDWLVDWMHGGWEFYNENDPDSVKRWRPKLSLTGTLGCPYSQGQYNQRLFDMIPYPRPMLDSATTNYFDSTYVDETTDETKKAFPYMNKAALYDIYSLKRAGLADTLNPGLIVAPLNLDLLKWWLNEKWGTAQDTMWAYDVQAGEDQVWPLPENLAYTNTTLSTAGMGGFPLGDLYNWWNPAIREGATDHYTAWLAQADLERAKIAEWLETGKHPDSPDVAIKPPKTGQPFKFTLNQNYPNPFNPTTQIRYTVPREARISLKVYNTLGQEVATLYDGIRPAGDYVTTFDAAGLAGGIYFYNLKSEGINITKKLVLIK